MNDKTNNSKSNNNNQIIIQVLAIAITLIILTTGYVIWGHYLADHFVGTFDQYGLPVQFSHTGWMLLVDAWPLWVTPLLVVVSLIISGQFFFKHYIFDPQKKAEDLLRNKENHELIELRNKSEKSFTHALEIETLKQQVDILKKKYFEEHKKAEEAIRSAEVAEEKAAAKIAAQTPSPEPIVKIVQAPGNAHNEAIISSLKAENKKLQKQITELKEDLEQSNALIEKLLETQ